MSMIFLFVKMVTCGTGPAQGNEEAAFLRRRAGKRRIPPLQPHPKRIEILRSLLRLMLDSDVGSSCRSEGMSSERNVSSSTGWRRRGTRRMSLSRSCDHRLSAARTVRGRGGYDHCVPFAPRGFFRLFQVGEHGASVFGPSFSVSACATPEGRAFAPPRIN